MSYADDDTLFADDLPRLENPETGVRHAVTEDGTRALCGAGTEDYELTLDGSWEDYDTPGALCARCTAIVSRGLLALLDDILDE